MDDIQGYMAILLVSLASIIMLRSIFKTSKFRLPPSPLTLPIIGHFHLLKAPLHRTFQNLSDRCGPLIHLYLGSTPIVVVSSAEIAQEILKTHEISFSNRPANVAMNYLTYNSSNFALAPYGTFWKFMKKLCMSELLNGKMLDQFLPIRQEEINRFMLIMQKKGEACERVNVGDELLKLTNSIVMRMAIGKSCFNTDEEAHKVTESAKEFALLSGMFNLADYFWFFKGLDLQGIGKKLKETRDNFDTMMECIVRDHEEERKKLTRKDAPKDVLDALLSYSQDQSSEVKITRDNIKAFLMDLFIGGTDTSAVTLEWSPAELINHPTIMEKARKEIDTIIGKDRIITEFDIENLPYLQAIVKETLRLYPPSPFLLRMSSKDCTIAGYDIPAKTRVFTNVWAIGRDPKHWDDPLEFRPERFLNDESGKMGLVDVRGQHYHLLPFGSGRRGCPGTSLALKVVPTTLAAMIQCFEWKGEKVGGNCGSVDMKEGPSIFLSRAQPLICYPKPRLMAFPLCHAS